MADPVQGADIPVAFIAGLVSFLSPCVLPLVPGYLSAITGVSPDQLGDEDWRRILVPSLLFIASFSAIFILLGLAATQIGSSLRENQDTLSNIGAVLLIAMGVLFLTDQIFRISIWMQKFFNAIGLEELAQI